MGQRHHIPVLGHPRGGCRGTGAAPQVSARPIAPHDDPHTERMSPVSLPSPPPLNQGVGHFSVNCSKITVTSIMKGLSS